MRPIDADDFLNTLESYSSGDSDLRIREAINETLHDLVPNILDDLSTLQVIEMKHWNDLKTTIAELSESEGTASQGDLCRFLLNYMEVLEKK